MQPNSIRRACKSLKLVARDGIEPPTPAFSGLLTDNAKWFRISAGDSWKRSYGKVSFRTDWDGFRLFSPRRCSLIVPALSRISRAHQGKGAYEGRNLRTRQDARRPARCGEPARAANGSSPRPKLGPANILITTAVFRHTFFAVIASTLPPGTGQHQGLRRASPPDAIVKGVQQINSSSESRRLERLSPRRRVRKTRGP